MPLGFSPRTRAGPAAVTFFPFTALLSRGLQKTASRRLPPVEDMIPEAGDGISRRSIAQWHGTVCFSGSLDHRDLVTLNRLRTR